MMFSVEVPSYPGSCMGPAERPELLWMTHARVGSPAWSSQILHILFPPDKAPDDGKDPPVMQPHEDFERLLIPSLRLLDVMGFVVGPLAFLPGRPLDTSPFDKLRGLRARDRLRTILSPIVTHAEAIRLRPCFR